MAQLKLTNADLTAALVGMEFERDRLGDKIREIRQMLGGRSEPATSADTAKPRKKRSAAVRRRMALAQRARFAKLNQGSKPGAQTAKPKKRKMSAAGRRAISLAAKKRWAAIKAAKKVA